MPYSHIDFCNEIFNHYAKYIILWEKHNVYSKTGDKTRKSPSAVGSFIEELVKGCLIKYIKNNNQQNISAISGMVLFEKDNNFYMSRQIDLILYNNEGIDNNTTEILKDNGLVPIERVKVLIEIKKYYSFEDFGHPNYINKSLYGKIPIGIIGIQERNNTVQLPNEANSKECIIGKYLTKKEVRARGNNRENLFCNDQENNQASYELNPNNNVMIFLDWLMQNLK